MNTIEEKNSYQDVAAEAFLDSQDDESFGSLFKIFSPQLVSFFRARGCRCDAEDLAQEVMMTVYREATRIRDRAVFRPWLFTIARHALYRHQTRHALRFKSVDLSEIPEHLTSRGTPVDGTSSFEFVQWMSFLTFKEREALTLRFIEGCEYHEIAAAQNVPIGTAQWRIFRAKRKLAPRLRPSRYLAPDVA